MEEFTPSERSALQICYDKLRNAHIFVGIYAFRYGYVPDVSVVYTTKAGEERSGDNAITVFERARAVEVDKSSSQIHPLLNAHFSKTPDRGLRRDRPVARAGGRQSQVASR
jgi:Domain of unknown function (DUF4062)